VGCLAGVDALEKPLLGIEPRFLGRPVPSLVTVCTVPSFLGAFAKKTRKTTISFVMSVCLQPSVRPSAWDGSAATGRIFVKFEI
jgi:hypothetical protein